MKVYLAGPITGMPNHNQKSFSVAASFIRLQGHEVVNPIEMDGGNFSKPYSEYMRRDIEKLMQCEGIALLPNWERSRGAMIEFQIARVLEMPMFNAFTMQPMEEYCALHNA